MKFDTLLAQYLYQHKRLNLPGIGTFEADASVGVPDDNDKQRASFEGIRYRSGRVLQPDDDLIEFIKTHTGKMKPLALSDLEDYLALGKQFLNIGKPFYIEGIGTLKLTRDGKYEFTPGAYVTTRLEDPASEKMEGRSTVEYAGDHDREQSSGGGARKAFAVLAILASIALIGWAGYYLYTLNTGEEQPVALPASESSVSSSADSLEAARRDSIAAAEASLAAPGQYRFVVERATRKRAMFRFQDLRSFGNKIMVDSTNPELYKLYYLLPATAADTARIRDSLNRWYYGNTKKRRVTIEQ